MRFSACALFLTLASCTALLGDFKTGPSDGGGGLDGSPDSPTSTEGGADTGPDAAPPPMLKCTVDLAKKYQVAEGVAFNERFAMFPAGSQDSVHIVLEDYGNNSARCIYGRQTSSTWQIQTSFISLSGGVTSVQKANGNVLIMSSSYKSPPQYFVARWPDISATPNGQTALTLQGEIDAQANQLEGTIVAADASKDDYLAVVQYNIAGTNFQLRGVRAMGGVPGTLKDIETNYPEHAELHANQLTLGGGGKAFLYREGGKTTGGSMEYTLNDSNGTFISKREVKPQGGANFISATFAAQNDTLSNDVGFIFIEGDLVNASVPPEYRTGTIDRSKLGLLETKDFAVTPIASVTEVVADKARCEWSPFSQPIGPQGVCIGPNMGTNPPKGVNMFWWNGKGNLRSKQVGSNALILTESVVGVAMSFRGTPNALLAEFFIAWLEPYKDTVTGNDVHRLWISSGGCQ